MKRCTIMPLALLGAALAVPLVPSGAGAIPPPHYKVLQRVVLGGQGGWDYLNIDAGARRLYISRGDHVDVVNMNKMQVVGKVENTPGVHGIALDTHIHRGFTSNGGENTVTIFDLRSLAEIGRPAVGTGPDAIVYDPYSDRVFTMNGRSQDTTAINARTGKVEGTLALGGRPEFAAADGRGHVFVNLEDKSEIVRIDSRNLTILNTWPLAPGEGPSGLSIDPVHHRLFSTCHNGMMVVMDADDGDVVATPAIGQGTDASWFDPGPELAFSSNGDGTLTILHEDTANHFTSETVNTEAGARTMAEDSKTHKVYLVTAQFAPPPPEPPADATGTPGGGPGAPAGAPRRFRRQLVPGSFVVLVVGPSRIP